MACLPVRSEVAAVVAAAEDGEGVAGVRRVAGGDGGAGGRVARGRDGDGGGRVLHLRVVRGMMRGRRGRVAMASMRMRVRGPHGLPEEWRFVPRVVEVVVQLALVVSEEQSGIGDTFTCTPEAI